jgi:hypothetical protein
MSTEVSQLGYSTLQDVVNDYSSLDANAKFIKAAEVLDRACPLISYLPMVPSNQILSNVAVRADSIPVPGTRRFNTGVQPTAAKDTPINDPMALFEAYSEVDFELYRIHNQPDMWRMQQDMRHIEGFKQLLESLLFYGNLANDPGQFNGLATRFNNLESYPNGDTSWQPNVWNNGGTSTQSLTSAWFLELGPMKVYGIYPPNTPGGLNIENLGQRTKETPNATGGGPQLPYMYEVLRTHFTWRIGLQVNDERCVQRVANINSTPLSSNNFDENLFIEARDQLPNRGEAPGTVLLMNRNMCSQVDIRSVSQKLNAYTFFNSKETDVFGRSVTRFQNIPILMCEKILNTETLVS